MARLLKLGVYDAAYLHCFYRDRPALVGAPYAEQHTALIADRAASSDFWTAALTRRGYATCDLIANAAPLQARWAIENGLAADCETVFAVTAAQVAAFAPDILLIADYSTFTPAYLRQLRATCPSLRLIVGWCGAPYRDLTVMREWDIALSCVPEIVDEFRAAGLDTHHVDHGFEPRILKQLAPPDSASVAFSFIGSVWQRDGYHRGRAALLARLVEETPLEIWSPSGDTRSRRRRWLDRLRGTPQVPALASPDRPPLYGLAMFATLRDSHVTFNSHIDISPRSASNMRLFEATGVGACLLTDRRDNLSELFADGSEVVSYGCADEAIEAYAWLADHPAERAAIAAAGQRRTLADHNFDRRAERLDAILGAAL
ncbi:glycosyltransferase family protein [Glacieibacterium frigidum]|uniref:Glycosyltransferase family 1 protein n=1 Tax=Glacieibacterium frigidum TaxID=2593303 RepID=A0A552UG40_9SPHN|nr:glycosyltransferase [Glacieibacterium frigidum]TRW17198.1 glycosyltransferase family 1 protein [Glacieibacterium frigidum]